MVPAKRERWLWAMLLGAVSLLAVPAARAGTVTIQPYHLCDLSVPYCGDLSEETYLDFGKTIWEQAGIGIRFLDWIWLSADFLDLNSAGAFAALNSTADPDSTVVSMWFVRSITWCGDPVAAGIVFGCSAIGVGRSVISDVVFAQNRYDTIYHELGHNLGLDHTSAAGNLMASGDIRVVPVSVNDILSGTADQLTPAQIAIAAGSPLNTPEPASWALPGAALGLLLVSRSRVVSR